MRTSVRWAHLMAWPLGAFIHTPARESEAFVLFVQVGLIPAFVLTGAVMWQQARLRRLISRSRRWRRHGTANDPG